jgi:ribulose-phosphate 3-epimerase
VVDLHLMFQQPTKWTEMLVSLNPNLVIFHAEAEGDLLAFAEHLRKFGIKVGVALLPETTVESARELIEISDHVLIFAGKLGAQGGEADLSQLSKVKQIYQVSPDIEIGWDGGVMVENIAEIASVGVDVINVGSAISKAKNPEVAFKDLTKHSQV